MCAASTSSSGSSMSPASTAASKGVCGSMVRGYTLTCVTPRRTASRTLSSNDASDCPGMPHMTSTLTFSNRVWAASTARRASSAVCARPSVRSTASSKLCTPRDRRFTPSAHTSRTMRPSRLSGFASMVHSTSGVRCIESDSVYSSIDRRASPTCEGVPAAQIHRLDARPAPPPSPCGVSAGTGPPRTRRSPALSAGTAAVAKSQ